MTFDEAFARVLSHEGGFSDHAADTGGATRWGITERVARAHGYHGLMRELPAEFARIIYRASYWDACQCDQLPGWLRMHVFDAAVNSGTAQAALWLQRAVGAHPDGIIGAKTIACARRADPGTAVARFNAHRLRFLAGLPTWPVFGRGWARRIAANLQET
ncbi:glycoside hydrolase family 108 protein [Azoarcus sp. PA01]|nr:glycoside hydrolase family 108 protein [Azoarcus sp. PA01]